MRMTMREKGMLMALLVLISCGVFYNYDYVPTDKKIQAGEAELAKLTAEHEKLLAWQDEAAQTEVRISAVQSELNGWVREAKAVSDIPLVIRFFEAQAAMRGITLSSIRLGTASATLTFRSPTYAVTRAFLLEMEKMIAFEVLKYRYGSSGLAVDGSFDIKLHVGKADESKGLPPGTPSSPFVR